MGAWADPAIHTVAYKPDPLAIWRKTAVVRQVGFFA